MFLRAHFYPAVTALFLHNALARNKLQLKIKSCCSNCNCVSMKIKSALFHSLSNVQCLFIVAVPTVVLNSDLSFTSDILFFLLENRPITTINDYGLQLINMQKLTCSLQRDPEILNAILMSRCVKLEWL